MLVFAPLEQPVRRQPRFVLRPCADRAAWVRAVAFIAQAIRELLTMRDRIERVDASDPAMVVRMAPEPGHVPAQPSGSDARSTGHHDPGATIVGHVSRDSASIEARDKLAAPSDRAIPARRFVRPAAPVMRLSPPHASANDALRGLEIARAGVSSSSSRIPAGTGPRLSAPVCSRRSRYSGPCARGNARVVHLAGSGQPGQSRGGEPGRFPGQARPLTSLLQRRVAPGDQDGGVHLLQVVGAAGHEA